MPHNLKNPKPESLAAKPLTLNGGADALDAQPYRGTSLIRTSPPLGPCRRTKPRALWWSLEGGGGRMSKVPLLRRQCS